MPIVDITAHFANGQEMDRAASACVDAVSSVLSVPKEVVMVRVLNTAPSPYNTIGQHTRVALWFGKDIELNECLITLKAVRSPHLTVSNKARLADFLTRALHEATNTEPERTFVVFEEKGADEWAKGGALLGRGEKDIEDEEGDSSSFQAAATAETTKTPPPPAYDKVACSAASGREGEGEEEEEEEAGKRGGVTE